MPKIKLGELLNENISEMAQCPFCKGQDTKLHALFGSQLSTSQYYCFSCRVVFEYIKWESPSKQDV